MWIHDLGYYGGVRNEGHMSQTHPRKLRQEYLPRCNPQKAEEEVEVQPVRSFINIRAPTTSSFVGI